MLNKKVITAAALVLLLLATAVFVTGCTAEDAEDKGGWVFATDHEYSIRDDGYPGLCELYGFDFDDVVVMDLGVVYDALRDGEVTVAMGFATNPLIAALDLVNLKDDLSFHPVYNCSPVIREEKLTEYPEIADILNPIAVALDTDTMVALNKRVTIDDEDEREVAESWLKEQGFIGNDPAEMMEGDPVVVSSKEFDEQLILGQIAITALEYNGIPTVDEVGLVGSANVRMAQEEGEVDLYWEYTGTALITHLGYAEAITDAQECYDVVKADDLEKNGLVWLDYTPFDNTYTIMMRREDAEALDIETLSDLAAAINEGVAAPVLE